MAQHTHRRIVPCLAAAGAMALASQAHASASGWSTVANVGEGGLVALALGKSVADKDWTGARQLGLSLGVAEGAVDILKYSVRERRPDGHGSLSFPSGHAGISFAAAGYLQKRYGWQWGLPATAVAALVATSRVEGKRHRWGDVVVGAAIGEASAYVFTTPKHPNVHWLPWAGNGGGGMLVTAQF